MKLRVFQLLVPRIIRYATGARVNSGVKLYNREVGIYIAIPFGRTNIRQCYNNKKTILVMNLYYLIN
jgi:hypothetical protein